MARRVSCVRRDRIRQGTTAVPSGESAHSRSWRASSRRPVPAEDIHRWRRHRSRRLCRLADAWGPKARSMLLGRDKTGVVDHERVEAALSEWLLVAVEKAQEGDAIGALGKDAEARKSAHPCFRTATRRRHIAKCLVVPSNPAPRFLRGRGPEDDIGHDFGWFECFADPRCGICNTLVILTGDQTAARTRDTSRRFELVEGAEVIGVVDTGIMPRHRPGSSTALATYQALTRRCLVPTDLPPAMGHSSPDC